MFSSYSKNKEFMEFVSLWNPSFFWLQQKFGGRRGKDGARSGMRNERLPNPTGEIPAFSRNSWICTTAGRSWMEGFGMIYLGSARLGLLLGFVRDPSWALLNPSCAVTPIN